MKIKPAMNIVSLALTKRFLYLCNCRTAKKIHNVDPIAHKELFIIIQTHVITHTSTHTYTHTHTHTHICTHACICIHIGRMHANARTNANILIRTKTHA